jgi:hypothetical protein
VGQLGFDRRDAVAERQQKAMQQQLEEGAAMLVVAP